VAEEQSVSSNGSPSPSVMSQDNICEIISSNEGSPHPTTPARRRLGSISDASGHNYDLFSKPDPAATKTSFKLAEFFSRRSRLSHKNRVQLALILALGVLQISSTNWLKGKWTKDNILLVMDTPDKPLPYVTHRFPSRRHSQVVPMTTTTSSPMSQYVRNPSLFALGVFLLEVGYNNSIEDLATDDEKRTLSAGPFLTAARLSLTVGDELGGRYAQVVKACLNFECGDTDAEGRPKDSSRFAKRVMKEVVEPLRSVAEVFEG
jgi:hypothetical protein